MIPVPAGFPVPAAHQLREKMPDITAALPLSAETWRYGNHQLQPGKQPEQRKSGSGYSGGKELPTCYDNQDQNGSTAIPLKESSWIPMWLEQKRSFRRITVRVSDEIQKERRRRLRRSLWWQR